MSSLPPSESVVSRSLVDAWHADTASTAELRRGYMRFTRRPPTRSAVARLASGLALGLVLGVGLAQGASMVPWQRWLGAREVTVRPAAKPTAAPRAPLTDVTPMVPQPDLPVVTQPPTSAFAPARPTPIPVVGTARVVPPSGSSSVSYVQQQWQEAAAALRTKDFARAQEALLEVERSVAGGEREAARLARAQLLSSHGRTAEALQLLRDLQAHAQSSVVRDQSRSLSARLEKSAEPERSNEPAPEIKQP